MHPLVSQARALAIEMHDRCGHSRSNGEPYWRHPERVAAVLIEAGLSEEVVAAAWLHDVPEDCASDERQCEQLLVEIERQFGQVTAELVREVTNFALPEESMETKQQRLIAHAGALSSDAKWIKLADRFDNITGMENWEPAKRVRYAEATTGLLLAIQPYPAGSACIVDSITARVAKIRSVRGQIGERRV